MRKFTKGKIVSIVEDNDGRIPAYQKSGWKEVPYTGGKMPTAADELREQAVDDANENPGAAEAGKAKKSKATTPDKKVNAAIKAKTTAAADSEPMDDGLLKKDDANENPGAAENKGGE